MKLIELKSMVEENLVAKRTPHVSDSDVTDKLIEMGFSVYTRIPNKPYGVINTPTGSAFCYETVFSSNSYAYVKAEVVVCPKGFKAIKAVQATRDDLEEAERLAFEESEAACLEYNERMEVWSTQRNKEVNEKIQRCIDTLGFYPEKRCATRWNNYGSGTKELFKFNTSINIEQFKSFLTLWGISIVGEHIDAPVCQGEVELYSTKETFLYDGDRSGGYLTTNSELWIVKTTNPYYD